MTFREQAKAAYLDYVNNYLTVKVWAEHNDLKEADARVFISMGRQLHEADAKDTDASHYTLEVKWPGSDEFYPEFGDYDRDTVADERDDLLLREPYLKEIDTRIIKTPEDRFTKKD
ncbi:MAG: hypothetical protein AAFQ32_04640 [Pseudomonadota bacterium]